MVGKDKVELPIRHRKSPNAEFARDASSSYGSRPGEAVPKGHSQFLTAVAAKPQPGEADGPHMLYPPAQQDYY